MSSSSPLKGRYERREVLGEGGMGVVYRAFDRDLKREVALKTIRDAQDAMSLEMFRKECGVLASLNHPNIVDIYDIGEWEEEGQRRPYFVMPLLPGATLDRLIKDQPQRLTVDRVVEIISQACRGLHAAHDRKLVHRDLKPSNIFVLNDDSVKIIDFGVAHLQSQRTSTTLKGTLFYMAPEQIEMKPPSAQSDIFALGVVSFEALTRRRPFTGSSQEEVVRAILQQQPVPASELNPAVNAALSQVVHAAMAKKPFSRYATSREFADALQRALHGQPIERFDLSKIQPRVEKVEKAISEAEFDFANEVLTELESEGYLHTSIRPMRKRVDSALRDRTTSRLIDSARRRLNDQEYNLALQKVQEVLTIDPSNSGALSLKTEIERKRSTEQVDNWYRLVREHMENCAFAQARQALENVLKLNPADANANRLLKEIEVREQDYLRIRKERESNYEAALDFWQNGDVSAALSRIERVLDLDMKAPDSGVGDRTASYQAFYNKVRSEQDTLKKAYDEAKGRLAEGDFEQAGRVCEDALRRYPQNALFQALQFDVREQQRQHLSSYIAQVDRQSEAEPDLDRKVKLIEEALQRYPGESHFERALKVAGSKRDLVNSIVGKARACEERGQFGEATQQWDILRSIYPQYPGLDFELERVAKRREQWARSEAKARWVDQIDAAIQAGDPARARDLVSSALDEFPTDAELTALKSLAEQSLERSAEAQNLIQEAQTSVTYGNLDQALGNLRKAQEIDPYNPAARSMLLETLLKKAAGELDRDWNSASTLLDQAEVIDSQHPQVKSLRMLIADRQREQSVNLRLTRARQFQTAGNVEDALQEVAAGLKDYPLESRLMQLKTTLEKLLDTRATEKATARQAPPPPPAPPADFDELGATQLIGSVSAGQAAAPPPPPPAPPPPVAKPAPPPPPKPVVTPPVVKPAPPAPGPTPNGKKPFPILWVAAGLLVPLLGGAIWYFTSNGSAPPPPPPDPGQELVAVTIPVSQAGAVIKVDGRDYTAGSELKLAAGRHDVEISADGFETRRFPLEVSPGMSPIAAIELVKAVPTLVVSAGSGSLVVDAQPVTLAEGQYNAEITDGPHRLKVLNGMGPVEMSYQVTPGQAPEVKMLNRPSQQTYALIGSWKNSARIVGPLKASLNGVEQDVPPEGLVWSNLAPGTYTATVTGKETKDVSFTVGEAPSVTAWVQDPGSVDLVVRANEEGADVMVAGRKRAVISGGRAVIQLAPFNYTVSVVKPGFEDAPPQRIVLESGKPAELRFTLKAAAAKILISGAPAGAQVLVNGNPVGNVRPDGTFEKVDLAAGRIRLGLRKANFEPADTSIDLRAGESIPVNGATLGREMGNLDIAVTPASATITLAGGRGGATPRAGRNGLPPGDYTVTAQAEGYQTATRSVQVRPGQDVRVELALQRTESASKSDPKQGEQKKSGPRRAAAGELTGRFQPGEDGWQMLNGGTEASLDVFPIGTLRFEVLRKGKFLRRAKAEWIFVVSAQEYILFSTDDDDLTCQRFLNGKRVGRVDKKRIGKNAEEFEITVTANSVSTAIIEGGKQAVGSQTFDGLDLSQSRFAFRGPMGVRNFSFRPSR